eukprot:m.87919 g.87919  ORF g.87919 m.87919 type:complete len:432 (-) comp26136_c0_seq4:97-1392(-)
MGGSWRDDFAVKLVYFVRFAGAGSIVPFLPLYFINVKGVSMSVLGMMGTIRPLVGFIGAPLVTSIADQMGGHRMIYTICAVAATVGKLSYMRTSSISMLVAICIVSEFIGSGTGPMLDHAVLSTMKDPKEWGRLRLWGAISFGLAVFFVGLTITHTGGYECMFAIYAMLDTTSLFLIRYFLFIDTTLVANSNTKPQLTPTRTPAKDVPEKPKWNPRMLAQLVFSSSTSVAFFTVVLLCGIMTGIIENYLFIFLETDVQASKTLIGLSRAVTCAAEVPLFWYSSWLINRLGVLQVLGLACFCYFVRFVGYSMLQDAWVVLLIEPLHGFTYAVMWSASVSYAHIIAPKGMGTSSQGVLSGIHWGLGSGLGAITGSVLYQTYGARVMFRVASILACFNIVLLVCTLRASRHTQSLPQQNLNKLPAEVISTSQEI